MSIRNCFLVRDEDLYESKKFQESLLKQERQMDQKILQTQRKISRFFQINKMEWAEIEDIKLKSFEQQKQQIFRQRSLLISQTEKIKSIKQNKKFISHFDQLQQKIITGTDHTEKKYQQFVENQQKIENSVKFAQCSLKQIGNIMFEDNQYSFLKQIQQIQAQEQVQPQESFIQSVSVTIAELKLQLNNIEKTQEMQTQQKEFLKITLKEQQIGAKDILNQNLKELQIFYTNFISKIDTLPTKQGDFTQEIKLIKEMMEHQYQQLSEDFSVYKLQTGAKIEKLENELENQKSLIMQQNYSLETLKQIEVRLSTEKTQKVNEILVLQENFNLLNEKYLQKVEQLDNEIAELKAQNQTLKDQGMIKENEFNKQLNDQQMKGQQLQTQIKLLEEKNLNLINDQQRSKIIQEDQKQQLLLLQSEKQQFEQKLFELQAKTETLSLERKNLLDQIDTLKIELQRIHEENKEIIKEKEFQSGKLLQIQEELSRNFSIIEKQSQKISEIQKQKDDMELNRKQLEQNNNTKDLLLNEFQMKQAFQTQLQEDNDFQRKSKIKNLEKEIKEKDDRIIEMNNKITQKCTTINNLINGNKDFQNQIQQLQNDLLEQNRKENFLQNKLENLENQYKRQIEQLAQQAQTISLYQNHEPQFE